MLARYIRQCLFRVFAGHQGLGNFFERGNEWIHGGPFHCRLIVNGW
jgi:hypothetical protein